MQRLRGVRAALLLMGAIFLAVGLGFAGAAAWQRDVCERLRAEGVSAEGVISYESSSDMNLVFEAEGQIWTVPSTFRSSLYRTGDPVTVWYMPGDPGSARITEAWTWRMFGYIGAAFALIGAGFAGWQMIGIAKERSLRANGQAVTAQVTEIRQRKDVKINGRHPYVIHAVCTHPYTGQEMKVKSRMLMNDPAPFIRDGQVSVLVDPMSDRRYYVEIERLR